ncbi:uncharacterized protein LOC115533455 isoform X1 [Gadus morhua]|uniref:uncharacterized protein LOC115533455 isoform X1 n=1 Tax=Gadus morhua TaxID=8049 RepID=UPI0011B3D58D|nr:uncharacterized protein LOC115533455 isoform X1 [Gadus morhua]
MATEMTAPATPAAPEPYKWSDEDTVAFVRWRVAHNKTFSGGRATNAAGYKVFLEERRLLGRVTAPFLKRKWENLKQKYKDLKNTPTSVSTEGDETTAASWKWFDLMHEAIGDRPSVTPPVLIATCAQGAVVFTAPSISTPERGRKVEAAEETALGSPTPTTTGTSTASTPKRRRMYVVEVLQELKSQDEQDWRALQAEEREREKRREAEQARQAAEREQREERSSRDGAWGCCLPSWILFLCCSSLAVLRVLRVQHVSLAQANIVEYGAAEDDLRDEQDVHLQRLHIYGPPSGLQDPKGPLHHYSGLCQPAAGRGSWGRTGRGTNHPR